MWSDESRQTSQSRWDEEDDWALFSAAVILVTLLMLGAGSQMGGLVLGQVLSWTTIQTGER